MNKKSPENNSSEYPLKFLRNTKRKKMAIKVVPFEGVIVELPPGFSRQDGEKFVKLNREWILKAVSRVKAKEEKFQILDEKKVFKTRFRDIYFRKFDSPDYGWELTENRGIITIPLDCDFGEMKTQQIIRAILEEIFRNEAKVYLPGRLRELAGEHNFRFNKVFIKNHKSKWGSCSSKNNINLNLHLMRLPDELIDYILLHELTHTLHKNHGAGFWSHLEKVCPGAKSLDKKLNLYSVNI